MWYGKIFAKDRRILMIQWIGYVWREFFVRYEFVRKLFEKIGCFIIVDGLYDDKIRF